jgi:Na+-transporting methylmalonyl-CoA/oxaloacetate decarboxylase gamma subunit
MKLWGVTPVLAAALLGGIHIASPSHAIPHNAAQPSATPSTSPTAAATPLGLPPATPAPVLRQVGSWRWQVTVLLTDTGPACRGAAAYWLETTPPTLATARPAPPRRTGKASSGRPASTGSSCQVTVTFTGLKHQPATAALVIDQAGSISAIPLTVSRDVPLAWYLGIPAVVGGGMALAFLLLSLLWVTVYTAGRRVSPFSGEYWKRPVLAAGAWTAGDSWATNITAVLALIGTVLATATATSSLFPGVALDRFALVNIAAGGIIVATPIVFGILYALFAGASPDLAADATIWLPPSADNPGASIAVPAGASILVPGAATVSWGDRPDWVQVLPGRAIAIPPGGDIGVLSGATLAIGGGTADIAVHAGGILTVSRGDGDPGELIIPDGDRVRRAPRPMLSRRRLLTGRRGGPGAHIPAITFPARITTPGGARISVVGTAGVALPRRAQITAPQRQSTTLRAGRELVVPRSSNVLAASLGTVLAAAVVTVFGIGAELGIVGTLAFGLSEASSGWRWAMLTGIGLVAVVMLVYAVTATGALANPEPGSSTSSAPGTSFTL